MIARTLLALMLCPVLGALTGSWVVRRATGSLAACGVRLSGGAGAAYGVLAGAGIGVLFAGLMIWCFSRGARSPQRALADLIIIALAVVALVDAFRLTERTWGMTAVVWLLGLLLCLIAVGRFVLREEGPEEEPEPLPLVPEDDYL